MLVADFNLGQALLTVIEIFFFVALPVDSHHDHRRPLCDHEMSGWGKAGWIVILLIIPLLGSLIYLIARGNGMRDRALKEQADMPESTWTSTSARPPAAHPRSTSWPSSRS